MRYRNFTIEPSYMSGYDFYSDDYDYAPDGVSGLSSWAGSIEEAKTSIDEYYFEDTTYLVHRTTPISNTITKFLFLQDAIEFCKAVGENAANIKTFFKGREIQFDSI